MLQLSLKLDCKTPTKCFKLTEETLMERNQTEKSLLGTETIFTCYSAIKPLWFFELQSTKPVSPPIISTGKFKISSTRWKHGGYYFCYGSSNNGATHFLHAKILEVYGMCNIMIHSH